MADAATLRSSVLAVKVIPATACPSCAILASAFPAGRPAARGSALLSTAHGPSFYIAPRYRPPLDPESVHYHRPEPNTEPYYDWPACQCTDPDAQGTRP